MNSDDQDMNPRLVLKELGLQPIIPWWLTHIKFFVGIRIWPCKHVGKHNHSSLVLRYGSQFVQMCKSEEAEFWTVFGLYRFHDSEDQEVRFIIDGLINFGTHYKAQKFCDQLLKTYPHLDGEDSEIIKTSNIEDGMYLVAQI